MSERGLVPIIWSPRYEVNIGKHVFPVEKYRLVKERLEDGGWLEKARLESPEPATDEDILRVHSPAYWEKITTGAFTPSEERILEIPFSDDLREASVFCAGGTTQAGRLALAEGRAVHLGGGFHHAFADHGEGFCLLNDVAIAVATLLAEGATERIAVVDLDVHHGNGTAAIFADEPRVFTFSMHPPVELPCPQAAGRPRRGPGGRRRRRGVPGTPTGAPTPYS